MKKIKASIKHFFSASPKQFILNHPNEKVFAVIDDIRNKNVYSGEMDFTLRYFSGYEFSISMIRTGARMPYPSIVNGIISTNEELQTVIDCKRQPNVLMILLFVISLIAGLVFIFKFLFLQQGFKNLGNSFLLSFIIPYFAVWYSSMTELVLYQRFEKYLRKSLIEN